MNIDELKEALHQLESETDSTSLDLDAVREQVVKSRRQLNFRDLRESVASVVVVVLFAPAIFTRLPAMTRLGACVTCLAAVVIGVVLWLGNRRYRSRPELSVDDYLGAEIAHLDYQVWLLRNVSWWYLAPLAIGFLMFVWGMNPVPSALVLSVGYYFLDRFINWLNQRAVRNVLIPQRNELIRVRASLNEPEASGHVFDPPDHEAST
jgi:hypothetical protein